MKNGRRMGLWILTGIFLMSGCKSQENPEGYVDNSPIVIEEEENTYQIEKCTEEDFTEEEIESTGGFWEDNTEGDPDVLGKLVSVDSRGNRTVLDRLLYYPDASENLISTENRFVYIGYPQLEAMNFKGRVYVSISKDGSDRTVTEAKDTPNILNLQYNEGYLYYGDNFDNVYRIDEDFGNRYQVATISGAFIGIVGTDIYYWSTDTQQPGIYRQNLAGTEQNVFVQATGFANPGGGTTAVESRSGGDGSVIFQGSLQSASGEWSQSEEFTLEIPLE